MATTTAQQWQGTGGIERRQFAEALDLARQMHEYELPPQELVRQLREVDPFLIQDAFNQAGWEILSGYGSNATAERERAVKEALRMWKRNPLYQWSVWLWTSWGLGESVAVDIVRATPIEKDPVVEVWREFRNAQRNEAVLGSDRIQELSDWLLNYGNEFLAFYISQQDGEATISEINPDEIKEIITHPATGAPLFYKRTFTAGTESKTWYYPDYTAYFSGDLDRLFPGDEKRRTLAEVVLPHGAFRADTQRKVGDDEADLGGEKIGTDVCILHIPHNRKEKGSLWGWPLSTCARPYLSAHGQFVDSRLAVAKGKAAFIRRKQFEGGSRGGKNLIGTIASNLSASRFTDTNPAAAPGSTELDNKGVTTTDLPMTTGAGDARTDNMLFSWMPLLGMGLFPTTAGLDTSRWATAVEMDKAQSMLFSRYQTFWRTQFERIVTIVIKAKEKYGGLKAGEYTIEVSVDSFSLADFPAVGKAIGQIVRDTLAPMVENGVLSPDAARAILAVLWRANLQALGVNAAGELTSDEAFGIGVEAEPEETEMLPTEAVTLERQIAELKERQVQQVAQERGRRDAAIDQALKAIEAAAYSIEHDEPMPAPALPDITVNVPEQPVAVTVEGAQVEVNLPGQAPPVVTVEAATIEAPQIEVTIPEVQAPNIIVNPPAQAPAPEVTVNVAAPEAPDITIEATLKQADEVLETETVVERDPQTDRITKTTKRTEAKG